MHVFFPGVRLVGVGVAGLLGAFKKKNEELRVGETLSDIIKDDRGSD